MRLYIINEKLRNSDLGVYMLGVNNKRQFQGMYIRYLASYGTDIFHRLLAKKRITIKRLMEMGRTPVVAPEIIQIFSV